MKWYMRKKPKGENMLVMWCHRDEAIDTAMVVSRSIKEHVWVVSADGDEQLFVGPTGVQK